MTKLLTIIPARGGSKGIPKKNIVTFHGKPLISWTIRAALSAPSVFQHVVVSTDDPEIAAIAKAEGADVPFLRPSELSTDTASGISTVHHAINFFPHCSEVLLLQPTSPLRTSQDIENVLRIGLDSTCDSIVSVTPSPKPQSWFFREDMNGNLYQPSNSYNGKSRQEQHPWLVLNGAIFYAKKDVLVESNSFITANTKPYVMPVERSIDIDTPYDLEMAEHFYSLQSKQNCAIIS